MFIKYLDEPGTNARWWEYEEKTLFQPSIITLSHPIECLLLKRKIEEEEEIEGKKGGPRWGGNKCGQGCGKTGTFIHHC